MSIGYTDFGRQTRQTGVQTINYSAVVSGPVTTGIQYCGDYGLLDVTVDCTNLADHYLVTATFYDDALGADFLYTFAFCTVPGTPNGLQIPAPGQYVKLQINNLEATDVNAFTLRARSTNQRHPNPWGAYSNIIPFLHNVSIGAGVVRTDNLVHLLTGPVILCATGEGSGTWHIYLDYWNFGSKTWVTFWRYDTGGNTNGIDLPINLPPAPVRVNMSNDGTSSHQFLYSITAQMV